MKQNYLVVYDYETGGVWAIVHARSKEEIIEKFPKLTIVETQPAWMTPERYQKIHDTLFQDIDDEPFGWFIRMARNPI